MLKQVFSDKNIIIKQGEISRIPFEDNYFDCVFITEVLEHLTYDDLYSGLQEIRRVLKPYGKFVITVPYKEQLQKIICPDCSAIFVPSQHMRSFDENSMILLLSQAGFRIKFCKLMPKIPLTGNLFKDLVKKILAKLNKVAMQFMYGSIFVTIAEK